MTILNAPIPEERKSLDGRDATTQVGSGGRTFTYEQFAHGSDAALSEIQGFAAWKAAVTDDRAYVFEIARTEAQRPENTLLREDGTALPVVNTASYNYLGYGYDPRIISAAQDAVGRFGTGVSASPVAGGTIVLHRELETRLVDFLGLEGKAVSLFTSGYAVNTGTVSAIIKRGGHIILDHRAHASLFEGARLSGGEVHTFVHNNMDDLERVLRNISRAGPARMLICAEGVYSADGDVGDLSAIVRLAKRYGAMTLVDEAHSMLVAGPGGRGVAADQGVLEHVDLLVVTFSKAFGGVGGAVIADENVARYINWYARCRLFSCAMAPATAGGLIRVLELAASEDGAIRRERLSRNAATLRARLRGRVPLIEGDSWVVPVVYGPDQRTIPLLDFLQRSGLEASMVQYPAAPLDEARIRMFVTSEHTSAQLVSAADIVVAAAERFGFAGATVGRTDQANPTIARND